MNSTAFSQKIESWLLEKSGCSLVDFCHKFNYPTRETKIMSLDETDEKKSKTIIAKDKELKDLYIACSKSEKGKARKGENRSWTRYFKDLITGWILENLTIEQFKRQGIDIRHNGNDAKRVIEVDGNVNQNADFIITVGDVSRYVEITNEFNSILKEHGFIEKRAPALFKLWKNKGIWIYRDLPRGKYVLVDFATEPTKIHLRHHNNVVNNWAKDVHRYVLSENGKKERDDRMLAPEIISVVGCGIAEKEQPILDEVEDADSPPLEYAIGGVLRKKNLEVSRKSIAEKPTIEKLPIISTREVRETQEPPPQSLIDEDQNNEEEIEAPIDIDYGDGDFV